MATNGSMSKRRKLNHGSSNDEPQRAKKAQKDFFKNASGWDLEQEYESRRRKNKKTEQDGTRLPRLNTDGGRKELLRGLEEDAESIDSDTEWLEGREDEIEEEPEAEEPAEEPEVPESQQILEAQEELAKVAMAVNENPEEHVGAFKALAQIGQSKILAIQMLALMTQMAVYKDVIPGYRIRPASENPAGEKLSKEVHQLRQYEQAMVTGYQTYIKELAKCAKMQIRAVPGGKTLSSVAIACVCTLITSVPHFNFREDLLRIMVGKLSKRKIDAEGKKCLEALETLFADDDEGRPSQDAVSLLSKMMKAKEYQVDERVVNLFLSLRLLSEFSGKASHDDVEIENGTEHKPKKNKREFRTKRQRKAMKEQKALEKDMANADALVSHEEREKTQSETLKLVFATYFRILKMRQSHLMGAVLEGLAKYAHLINQNFFGDLLEALKDLIRHSDADQNTEENGEEEDSAEAEPVESTSSRDSTREALLCTVTAFALLAGQDAHNSRAELHLDLSFFTTHLFRSLLVLSLNPDLEQTKPASSRTSGTSKINVQTTTVLLLRSLTGILLPAYNIRSVPPMRLAAFTKQLMSVAPQLPEKSCQGVLALLGDVVHTHGKKVGSLWNTEERKGDGQFSAVADSVEGSNPFAATVWEGELLRRHFSPKVREGVKLLEKELPT